MCLDDDFVHGHAAAPIILLEEFCMFNFEQFWKTRRLLPWNITHDCLVCCEITNILFSIVFFMIGIGVLHENKEAVTASCAEDWWIWTYCLMALITPIVIGAVLSIVKAVLVFVHAGRVDRADAIVVKLQHRYSFLFINLGHPIGRTVVLILGFFLSAGMPSSCVKFYSETYPDLLAMFNILIFLLFISTMISYGVLVVSVAQLRIHTPRYVVTALAYLEDLTPFSFYKTHVILNADGYTTSRYDRSSQRFDDDDNEGLTWLQFALLLCSTIYFSWGAAVLFHDEEARGEVGPCAKEAWIWSYVLLAILAIPATGIVVVLLRQWRSRQKHVEAEQRAAMDLWISVPQPMVTAVIAIVGAVLAGNISTYCSGVYQDETPDLLFFFEFQVVVLCAAAILGLLAWGYGLGRRAASVYQELLEREDDLSGMAARSLYDDDALPDHRFQ